MVVVSFFCACYIILALIFTSVIQFLTAHFALTSTKLKWNYKTAFIWPITVPVFLILIIYYVYRKETNHDP